MKAIILAAGRGRRLQPTTDQLPKTLIEIHGKTILDHQIEALSNAGVTDIVIVVGFQKDMIIAHATTRYPDISFTFVENDKYLETHAGYSLWCAREHLDGHTLYLNGDALFDPKIVKQIIDSEHDSVTAVQKAPWNEEQVNMTVDENLAIDEIGKHVTDENSYGEFIGITEFGPEFNVALREALEELASDDTLKWFAADAINRAIQKKHSPMYILDVTGLDAIEIDTPEELEDAKKRWK